LGIVLKECPEEGSVGGCPGKCLDILPGGMAQEKPGHPKTVACLSTELEVKLSYIRIHKKEESEQNQAIVKC